jgi:hypothetical protein
MIRRETSEVAIGLRLVGMTARLGHSAIPEEIANEARTALDELDRCPEGTVRTSAALVANWLIGFATAQGPDAQEFAARTLIAVTDRLREAMSTEAERAA